MTFDKSRIYTAVNADDLKVGSKCILTHRIEELKAYVKDSYDDRHVETLTEILDDDTLEDRFIGADYETAYTYAFLVEEPREPDYLPFETVDEARKAIEAHDGWIENVLTGNVFFVSGYGGCKVVDSKDHAIFLGRYWLSLKSLCNEYVFEDDKTPCGRNKR